jgi:murein L,D-transpeptidase YafK
MPHQSVHISPLPPTGHALAGAGSRPAGRLMAPALALAVGLAAALGLAGCGGETANKDYADRVLVKKSERKLQLLKAGAVVREYHVALGEYPSGHKMQEGDKHTPEGDYVLDWRNPNSDFHKSIHVSYPNEQDREVAKLLGVNPGGMIMIHGLPSYIASPKIRAEYQNRDWTNGCIAVQDHEMDEIWQLVRDGTPIRIQE